MTYYENQLPKQSELNPAAWEMARHIKRIFAHLPGRYDVIPGYVGNCRIVCEDGLQLYAFAEMKDRTIYAPDRIKFSVNKQKRAGYTYYGELPSIGVSPKRDDAAIARDIERRLMPAARAFFAAECEYLADIAAKEQRKDKMTEMLSAFLGEDPSPNRERTIYAKEGDARADVQVRSATNIKITFEYLDLETAMSILEAAFPERTRA